MQSPIAASSHPLHDELWLNVFTFLDPVSLSRATAACTHWRALASNDELLWKPHCARLWRDKQNCPLERWVRPLPTPRTDEAKCAPNRGGTSSSNGLAAGADQSDEQQGEAVREARREEAALRAEAARLIGEIEALQQLATEHTTAEVGADEGGGTVLVFDHPQLYHRFHALALRLQQCRLELSLAISRALRAAQPSSGGHAGLLPRPFSRAMPLRLARPPGVAGQPQPWWEQQQEQQAQQPPANDGAAGSGGEGEHAAELHAAAAPAAAVPTGAAVAAATAAPAAAAAAAAPPSPRFELLSWRQSFVASLEQSRRTCVRLEDLEGEAIIDFDGSLETARVAGGMFVDDRAFRNSPGRICIDGSRLVLVDIAQSAVLHRTADWGWLCVMDSGRVRWWTVDARTGPQAYAGPLRRRMARGAWERQREQRRLRGDTEWEGGWEPIPQAVLRHSAPKPAQRAHALASASAALAQGGLAALALVDAADARRAEAEPATPAVGRGGSSEAAPAAREGAAHADEEEGAEWMWQVVQPLETNLRLTHVAQTHRPPPAGAIAEAPCLQSAIGR